MFFVPFVAVVYLYLIVAQYATGPARFAVQPPVELLGELAKLGQNL